MFTEERNFRKRGLTIKGHFPPSFEEQTIRVGYGTPHELLLAAISQSTHNAEYLGRFYAHLYKENPYAVEGYLKHFVRRISTELDWSDCAMEVLPEYQHSSMDFQRSSPTLLHLLPAFFRELDKEAGLEKALSELPDPVKRIVKKHEELKS